MSTKKEKIEAVNNVVLVRRKEADDTSNGFIVPDIAKKKPHMAEIVSVGVFCMDKKIKVGKTAIYNQHSGSEIEMPDGEELYILRDNEILFVV